MRTPKLVTAALLVVITMGSMTVLAVGSWNSTSFSFCSDGCVSTAHVMNNTLNDNFTVFYQPHYKSTYPIMARTVSHLGQSKGTEHTLVADGSDYWFGGVAWHPKAKRFMLALKSSVSDQIRSVITDAGGGLLYSSNPIAINVAHDYSLKPQVAWARNGKFVVFYVKDDQVWAQLIRKNGNVFKGAKQLTSFKKGLVNATSAATEADGTAVCYFEWRKNDSATKLKPYMLKVDRKLNIVLKKRLSGPRPEGMYGAGLRGAYDPNTGTHAITVGSSFALFNEDGISLAPASSTYTLINGCTGVDQLIYDPQNERFVAFHADYFIDNVNYVENEWRYATIFEPDGTITEPSIELYHQTEETSGSPSCGVNRTGNLLGIVSIEGPGDAWEYGYVRAYLFYE